MSVSTNEQRWQDDLIVRYPDLFIRRIHGRDVTSGYPGVGDGWRDLVETAIGRLAKAVEAHPSGVLKIGQVKEKFGTLRLYVDRLRDLPGTVVAEIDEAIALAEARSACTCETCGAEGRLYDSNGYYHTACDQHGQGVAVYIRPDRKNIRIVRSLKNGKIAIVSCRRYVRETDSFVDVPPADVGLKE